MSGVWSGVYRQGGREVERKRSVEGRWYGTEGGREGERRCGCVLCEVCASVWHLDT